MEAHAMPTTQTCERKLFKIITSGKAAFCLPHCLTRAPLPSFPDAHFFQPSLYLNFAPLFTLKAFFPCISQKCCVWGYFWLS